MPTLQEQLIQKGLASAEAQRKNRENAQPRDAKTDSVPRMYRAQIEGRCSLQYIDSGKRRQNTQEDSDLIIWLQEWLYPDFKQNDIPELSKHLPPSYHHRKNNLGLQGSTYRIQIDFPFRLFSNCGQDTINRPVIGKQGIPCLPGSSVKGLFRRACTGEQIQKYCGDKDANDAAIPGTSGLRFHTAYPIGNWGERILDVVHPQENYQIGGPEKKHESAHPLISLYRPQLLFEFSASDVELVDWQEVKQILQRALHLGVGGKTSTGYGMSGYVFGQTPSSPDFGAHHRQFRLRGDGLNSKLLTQETEFRPNLFKATLRSHARRLLAGASTKPRPVRSGQPSQNPVDDEIERLFGCTDAPGVLQIVWQPTKVPRDQDNQVIYSTEGILHLGTDPRHPHVQPQEDMQFALQLLRFTYRMGGFGKSWRRVWHHQFYPGYYQQGKNKYPIGCHWVSPHIQSLQTREELNEFLENVHQLCCDRFHSQTPHPLPWRESWHPDRVAVYCRPFRNTAVIELFHDDFFKTTPAIGGKRPGESRPTSVSSVWHRMLPVDDSGRDYLEIVTVFHGDRNPWKRKGIDQLKPFVSELEANSMELAWGNMPQ